MRVILQEERAVEELSNSKATPHRMASLMESAGVVGTSEQQAPVVPSSFRPSIVPFDWTGGEDARSGPAAAEVSRYLSQAGIPIAATGAGFKVVDVRRRNILNSQLGRVLLKGRPDAVVIPAEQHPAMASQQARVIIDFKTRTCSFEQIMAQAQGELLAASSLSHHDVIVVFTDLNTFGHVLRAEDDKVLTWSNLSVVQTLFMIVNFIRNECAPVIVAGVDDARVPGEADAKRRRFSLVQRAHALVPRPTELMEQLEVFNTGHWEDYLEGRELLFSAIDRGLCPSYIA